MASIELLLMPIMDVGEIHDSHEICRVAGSRSDDDQYY